MLRNLKEIANSITTIEQQGDTPHASLTALRVPLRGLNRRGFDSLPYSKVTLPVDFGPSIDTNGSSVQQRRTIAAAAAADYRAYRP